VENFPVSTRAPCAVDAGIALNRHFHNYEANQGSPHAGILLSPIHFAWRKMYFPLATIKLTIWKISLECIFHIVSFIVMRVCSLPSPINLHLSSYLYNCIISVNTENYIEHSGWVSDEFAYEIARD
jgi:hypothetical protein